MDTTTTRIKIPRKVRRSRARQLARRARQTLFCGRCRLPFLGGSRARCQCKVLTPAQLDGRRV